MAVVVGSEGEGLSRLTREKCDFLVRLPMVGRDRQPQRRGRRQHRALRGATGARPMIAHPSP